MSELSSLRKLPAILLVIVASLTAAAPAFAGAGDLVPTKPSLQYGGVDIHGGNHRLSLEVSNASATNQTLSPVVISGADAADFKITSDNCSNTELIPAQSCYLEVEFRPQAHGSKLAALEVADGTETLSLPLEGEGQTGSLSASPLSFSPLPYTPAGSRGEEQNEQNQINISNSSVAVTDVGSVSIAGPDAASFSIAYGDCESRNMGPNETCNEEIRFQPVALGMQHAEAVIENDSGTTLRVPLEGEGVHGPTLSVSTRQAMLGDVNIGESVKQTFTLTNTGDYPLFIQQDFMITSVPLMFPMLSDTCSGQFFLPGASCSITVEFAPTATGQKDAAIVLVTNTSKPSISSVGLEGIGVDPNAPKTVPTPSPPVITQVREVQTVTVIEGGGPLVKPVGTVGRKHSKTHSKKHSKTKAKVKHKAKPKCPRVADGDWGRGISKGLWEKACLRVLTNWPQFR